MAQVKEVQEKEKERVKVKVKAKVREKGAMEMVRERVMEVKMIK